MYRTHFQFLFSGFSSSQHRYYLFNISEFIFHFRFQFTVCHFYRTHISKPLNFFLSIFLSSIPFFGILHVWLLCVYSQFNAHNKFSSIKKWMSDETTTTTTNKNLLWFDLEQFIHVASYASKWLNTKNLIWIICFKVYMIIFHLRLIKKIWKKHKKEMCRKWV